MNFLTQLWNSLKSQAWFVAVSSAAGGAVLDFLNDELTKGHLDFSKMGWDRVGTVALTAAIAAIVHLYRRPPNTPPNH